MSLLLLLLLRGGDVCPAKVGMEILGSASDYEIEHRPSTMSESEAESVAAHDWRSIKKGLEIWRNFVAS